MSGIQTAVLNIFKSVLSPNGNCNVPINLQSCLETKARVTLKVKGEIVHNVYFAPNWFADLNSLLCNCNVHTRLCWLKAVAGAWCTSARFAGAPAKYHDSTLPCVFGCVDCTDEITHYLICPVLWSFAREALNLHETTIFVGERLCFLNPSFDKLSLLTFCHILYHAVCNDAGCFSPSGALQAPEIVQDRAFQLSRNVKHLVRVS